jgi:hypothetical protein
MKRLLLLLCWLAFGITASAETITLLTSSNTEANGPCITAQYNVTREQMLTVPLWIPEKEPPPLPLAHGLALAATWLRLPAFVRGKIFSNT